MRATVLVLALCVAAVALLPAPVSAVRCVTPKGASVSGGVVSWWMGYKVVSKAAQNDQEFVWLSSQHGAGASYEVTTVTSGPLATTLNQLASSAADSADLRYIAWNDQPPANANKQFEPSHGDPGHSKGVIASSNTRGFYLTHSWPQFPDVGSYPNGFSSSQSRTDAITQAFFCFSVDLTGETPEKIMNHLGMVRPGIYDFHPSNVDTVDAAWSVIMSYPRTTTPPTNFAAKDVIPLIADSVLAAESGPAPTAASNPPTVPHGTSCGGGASCLYRRATAAGQASANTAPAYGAGVVQLFGMSVTNTPGTFWSAFRKWVFPGHPFTIQTWTSAAVTAATQLDESLFLSAPLKATIMSYACFASTGGVGNSVANCRERRELHSKVAVSAAPTFPVTCFADLNMEQTRSGGMICLQSAPVRSLVSQYVYAQPDSALSGGVLPPAVAMGRVDGCVSATAAACTVSTSVESLAAAYASAAAHPLAATPVTPAPTAGLKPPANTPAYDSAACMENPLPCPAFPARASGPVIALESSQTGGGAGGGAAKPSPAKPSPAKPRKK